MSEPTGELLLGDREHSIPVYSPACTFCQDYHPDTRSSREAFPDGIPLEIWLGDNEHLESFLGDHSIRFEVLERATKPHAYPP